MTPLVENFVRTQARRLRQKTFRTDPLFDAVRSSEASFVGSAQKRHGMIIELALRDALASYDRFKVWAPRDFFVPPEAEHLALLQLNGATLTHATVNYTGGGKHRQIDIAAFDRERRRLSSLEVKRATYAPDSEKTAGIMKALYSVQAVLPGFARTKGLVAETAEARLVCYYGARAVPAPWSLVRSELDDHFGCDITVTVDEATELFRSLINLSGVPDDLFQGGLDA